MQYTRVLIVIGCLLGAHVDCTLAIEDCHFNQYINSKVVSDYSAVLLNVTTIADCLAYLRDNKPTHKVVAFDASTQKCCAVLQTLAYEVEPEHGWTTFEIREPADSTDLPEPATTTPFLTTTTAPRLNISGICNYTDSQVYLRANSTAVLSVYSFGYDFCTDFSTAPALYDVTNACKTFVYSLTDSRLKFSIEYDTGEAILTLNYGAGTLSFSQKGSYTGVIPTTSMSLDWWSWNATPKKGFCLKIHPTDEGATEPVLETKEIDADPLKTVGMCDYLSITVPLGTEKVVQLSPYSYDFNLCDSFSTDAVLFNVSSRCSAFVSASNTKAVKFEIEYDNGDGTVYFNYGYNSIIFTGKGSHTGVLPNNGVLIYWQSWSSIPKKGFCLKLYPTDESWTESDLPSSDYTPTPDKTHGVCEYANTEIKLDPNTTAVLSPHSYDYDLCTNFDSAKPYSGSRGCRSHMVATGNKYLKLSIQYDTGDCCSTLVFKYEDESLSFAGKGSYTGVIPRDELNLEWMFWGTTPVKGFCLKVQPTDESPTEDVLPSTTIIPRINSK